MPLDVSATFHRESRELLATIAELATRAGNHDAAKPPGDDYYYALQRVRHAQRCVDEARAALAVPR